MIVQSQASILVPGCERHDVCAGAKQRVLNKVVGVVAIPAKRNGESAKPRHRCQHRRSDGRLKRSDLLSLGRLREAAGAFESRSKVVEIGCIDRLASICHAPLHLLC
jgi:hypothetical protein